MISYDSNIYNDIYNNNIIIAIATSYSVSISLEI